MKSIPFALVISRLFLAGIIVLIACLRIHNPGPWIALFILIGVLTDLFDGIVARKLGVATEKLRTWDSNVDVVFWLASIASVFALHPEFLFGYYKLITLLIVSEFMLYLISWIRFKRTVATHTYLAKIWTFFLLVFISDLALRGTASLSFYVCFGLGMISRLEIAIILTRLKVWQTDVKSLFALRRINEPKSNTSEKAA